MKRPRRARTAKLQQVLVYYDQPQVAYLIGDRGYKILAVAIEERRGMEIPFYCSEISDRLFYAYISGRVDLNFALKQGKRNRYYFFDWASAQDGETFPLTAALVSEISDSAHYPEPGFFSENHTHHLKESRSLRPARLAFHIDGKWDASDLSRFVGRVDEIYSFSRIVETSRDGSAVLRFLKDEIAPRSWTHGGDYTQFYRSLKSQPEAAEALRVERIAYNSPGEIIVRGEQDALREVADLIGTYKQNPVDASNRYTSLRSLLRKEGFLSRSEMPPEPTEGMLGLICRLANELLSSVGMQNGERLFVACRNDPIIYAKVSLSLIRRVRDAALFYAEGRVSSDRFVETISSG